MILIIYIFIMLSIGSLLYTWISNVIKESAVQHDFKLTDQWMLSEDLSEETLNHVKNLPEMSIDQLKEISKYDQTAKDYLDFKLALEKL